MRSPFDPTSADSTYIGLSICIYDTYLIKYFGMEVSEVDPAIEAQMVSFVTPPKSRR